MYRFVAFGGPTRSPATVDAAVIGNKGASLVELTELGFRVPPGFIIPAEACEDYHHQGREFLDRLLPAIEQGISDIEGKVGRRWGSASDPLLFSVRSSPATSISGIVPAVINLGLTDEAVVAARSSDARRHLFDCYRRLIRSYGRHVNSIAWQAEDWDDCSGLEVVESLFHANKTAYFQAVGREFPQDPRRQLLDSIEAIYRSWNADDAVMCRHERGLDELNGVAVVIQQMVFGNRDQRSGVGIAYTRHPYTGVDALYGEFVWMGQGDDVLEATGQQRPIDSLQEESPDIYGELADVKQRLESHFRDVQEIEFTVERGALHLLQTRAGTRAAPAAVKIACDLVDQGLIDERTAAWRVSWEQVNELRRPVFDEVSRAETPPLGRGLPAAPGCAVGRLACNSQEALALANDGDPVILAIAELEDLDLDALLFSQGVLVLGGGMTSPLASWCRSMGVACVADVWGMEFVSGASKIRFPKTDVSGGEWVSIDGATGEVWQGVIKRVAAPPEGDVARMVAWMQRYGNV